MSTYLIIYVLLFISVVFNVLLLFRIKYLREDIREIRGGVQLSQDELQQLRGRLQKIKERS
ncbi:MAG: hypothetical protein GXO66_07250 [Euryarchaeota archaeon]|nr:hypothetical protein [Euryarchaeota archaeon]